MSNVLDSHVTIYEGHNPYDFDNEILLNWYPQRVLELSRGASSILELGLGHGYTANIFSKNFSRYRILEGSAAVIENFKKRFPDVKVDIVETFFENYKTEEKFDVIVLGFILEHVDDPKQIIQICKNLLTPTGKMFMTVPNAEAMNRRLGHLAGLLPDMQELSGNDLISGHKRYYTAETFKKDIEISGCRVDKLEGIYLKPFTTQQIKSLNLNKSIVDALCKLGVDYPELCLGMMAMVSKG